MKQLSSLHLLGGMLPLALVLLLGMGASTFPPKVSGPLQQLGNTATAMLQVKSAHVVVALSSTTHLSRPLIGSLPQDITVKVTGSGVEALPQEQQMNLIVNNLPATQETLSQGKWFVEFPNHLVFMLVPSIPGSLGTSARGRNPSPTPGTPSQNLDVDAVIALVQHLQITDHGEETVSGMRLHHIAIALDTQAIKQLLSLAGAQGKQVAEAIQWVKGTADLFINDTNSLVYRVGLTGTVNVQIPALGQKIPATTQFTAQMDLSQFNQPVTIVAPKNPIMLTIPLSGQ